MSPGDSRKMLFHIKSKIVSKGFLPIFAHVTAGILSWHVQISVAIWLAGPCITNVIATCRKNFSQWESSFLWKLRCHWLKFLRRVAKTLVIHGPGIEPNMMSLLLDCTLVFAKWLMAQGTVLLLGFDAAKCLLANGSVAFIWKLHCYWLRGLYRQCQIPTKITQNYS